MACFLVPAAEAVVATVIKNAQKKKEKETALEPVKTENGSVQIAEENRISFSGKLGWLTNMLWGGSALLGFEHLWHGEISPAFPFLTAAGNPSDAASMLQEMGTVGVSMAMLVTAAWGVMVLVTNRMEKKAIGAEKESAGQEA